MRIAIIGNGAIARHVQDWLAGTPHVLAAILMRPGRSADAGAVPTVHSVTELPAPLDLVVDCAGHAALAQHGPAILASGTDLLTVSLGALADAALHNRLREAAERGGARLHLASGAIGALDCLQAARAGGLTEVTYRGRKPPAGWAGSPAEAVLDLAALTEGSAIHFDGTARAAALAYPKNANVAAAVALAGLGFDATRAVLIAEAGVTGNIHEIEATGAFGQFSFRIEGRPLPGNPRSSALAAMSVTARLEQLSSPVVL